MSCLCLGPKRAGKTLLLKALQDPGSVDETTFSMPTIGTSIYTIKFPPRSQAGSDAFKQQQSGNGKTTAQGQRAHEPRGVASKSIQIVEIGGSMAPLWNRHLGNVKKLLYVVDTSNLCQISAAGVLFYALLTEPRLQRVKILLVLAKMDYAYRQMRNEALLMLQMSKLQKQIRQTVTIVEASSVTKLGLDKIYDWLQVP